MLGRQVGRQSVPVNSMMPLLWSPSLLSLRLVLSCLWCPSPFALFLFVPCLVCPVVLLPLSSFLPSVVLRWQVIPCFLVYLCLTLVYIVVLFF